MIVMRQPCTIYVLKLFDGYGKALAHLSKN